MASAEASGRIDSSERIVHNWTRATFTLWHHTTWSEFKMRVMRYGRVWKHDPEVLFNVIYYVCDEEIFIEATGG
jgi:hypothetical protein